MNTAQKVPDQGNNHSLDFLHGIPWNSGVDLSNILLPLDTQSSFISALTVEEKHALSWAMGLLAASAIEEHEHVLNDLRHISDKFPTTESSTFFLEEANHSAAFRTFLSLSSEELKLSIDELKSFLPVFLKSSILARLYALESRLGGNAIWWTVAATEEESIRLYQNLISSKDQIDPVFFELNRLHFLEESRHSSFSYKVLGKKKSGVSKIIAPFSFSFSRVLQTLWLWSSIARFRGVKRFADRHPLLGTMSSLVNKIDALTLRQKLNLIFKDISYIRMMTEPEEHPRIRKALKKENAFVFTLPEFL